MLPFSFPDALEALKEISESACPNDGFLDQVGFVHDLLAAMQHMNSCSVCCLAEHSVPCS
jgi:hypothetical protein